jgi:hypothetical protein
MKSKNKNKTISVLQANQIEFLNKYTYWWQFLRYTVPAHKIANKLGEARARAPVRAPPSFLAIFCAG